MIQNEKYVKVAKINYFCLHIKRDLRKINLSELNIIYALIVTYGICAVW